MELLAVDRDSTADIAVDMDHIRDTAGSTADTVADTTVQQSEQQLEQQLELENLRLQSDSEQLQV